MMGRVCPWNGWCHDKFGLYINVNNKKNHMPVTLLVMAACRGKSDLRLCPHKHMYMHKHSKTKQSRYPDTTREGGGKHMHLSRTHRRQ
jgi:hypothetical protein